MLCYPMQVNANGALQWGSPVLEITEPNSKLIAPYFTNTDVPTSTSSGEVYYRSTNDAILIQQVTDTIAAHFVGSSAEELTISNLFIATWHQIPQHEGPTTQVYTNIHTAIITSPHNHVLK